MGISQSTHICNSSRQSLDWISGNLMQKYPRTPFRFSHACRRQPITNCVRKEMSGQLKSLRIIQHTQIKSFAFSLKRQCQIKMSCRDKLNFDRVTVRCLIPKFFVLQEIGDELPFRLVADRRFEVDEQFLLSDKDFYWATLAYSKLSSDQKQGIFQNVGFGLALYIYRGRASGTNLKDINPEESLNYSRYLSVASNVAI